MTKHSIFELSWYKVILLVIGLIVFMSIRDKLDERLDNAAFINGVSAGETVKITDACDFGDVFQLQVKGAKLVYVDESGQAYELSFQLVDVEKTE